MKIELKRHDEELPDDVSLALVICGATSAEGQRHAGFVVRNLLGEVWLYHLGGNNRYLRTPFTPSYKYLLIPIMQPETASSLINFLAILYDVTGGRIQYSIGWDDKEYFDEDGAPVSFEAGDGFTCATFVLESLKRYGLDMVARNTWPITAEDTAWQAGILHVAQLAPEQFLAQVEKVGKYPRFRPEQALGAAHYFTGSQLPYSTVSSAGLEVVAEMVRLSA
jgi:hypothetical protein